MISEQTVLMQLNWLSRDSVGKTVFYFFFQWQLENRIITIAPVVSFIWSLKTVIYSSLWLGDRNFVLTQKLLASPKKNRYPWHQWPAVCNPFLPFIYAAYAITCSMYVLHVTWWVCCDHITCFILCSFIPVNFSSQLLLVLQLFSSMSYIPFKHFGKLCPFLLWHYYLSFFKHTFPYFFFLA